MSNMNHERVLSVHHWNDTLFSFKCTRDPVSYTHLTLPTSDLV